MQGIFRVEVDPFDTVAQQYMLSQKVRGSANIFALCVKPSRLVNGYQQCVAERSIIGLTPSGL